MSDELKLADVIALFNAIEGVLELFNMHDERHHAPRTILDEMRKLHLHTMRADGTDATSEDRAVLDDIYRKLVLLHTYAKIVKNAPAGIGRAGAGKGR